MQNMNNLLQIIKKLLHSHKWIAHWSYAAFAAVGVVASLAAAGQPKLMSPPHPDKAFSAEATIEQAIESPTAEQSVSQNSISHWIAGISEKLEQIPAATPSAVPTSTPSPVPSPTVQPSATQKEAKQEAKTTSEVKSSTVKKEAKATQAADEASSEQSVETLSSNSNVILLAKIMWSEARGESDAGQIAVGTVVMNRVDSAQWPDTIKGVLTQKSQFAKLSKYDRRTLQNAIKVYQGERNLPSDVCFFKATRTGKSWSGRTFVKQIGNHYFYR